MRSDLSFRRPMAQRRPALRSFRRLFCGLALGAVLAACVSPPPVDTAVAPARSEPPPVAAKTAPVASAEQAPALPAPAAGDVSAAAGAIGAIDEASNVYFALRSAQVDASGQQKLRAIADRLAGNRRASVLLVGHSDGQGSRSYNLALTEERLVAVGKLLRSYGVGARQIRRNRVGSVRSAPDCKDEACWQQARRVELLVTP